ncbi:polysaccharide biosynthesis C-terminal domain-containing protein [Methanobacterium alkalithermotolerans]|uniref:Polysaccharide biosynthesis C-terminal domain-containing protein n=1 Tax=Methanobacterium alkalithermotolerans TaxID=2731220 RepID=A0A8T8KAZ6_9EURY|nr:polysaccharide biosynthesis C-terminal domain-containing protein [Methanobacterium alkalithermotolerans]QUH22571.1 polysaccharide biosynthesis C-terminal domain-containing protein [Methanobacterium alkalithermotolerans]
MSEYKSFMQRMGLLGLVNVLTAMSTIILIPILSNNLSITDFGMWNIFQVTIRLFGAVATLGLPNAVIRYLPSIKEKNMIQEGYYSIILFAGSFILVLSFFIFLLSDFIAGALLDGNVFLVQVLSLVVYLGAINTIIVNYFRAFKKIKIYSLFLFLQVYLSLVLVSYAVIVNQGINGAILAYLIGQVVIFIIMNLLIIREIGIYRPRFTRIREYLDFSLPMVPSAISYWIVESSDKYLIGLLLGTSFVGFYSPAYSIGNLIALIMMPFPSILLPTISRHFDNGKMDQTTSYFTYSVKLFLFLSIPAVFGISVLAYPLLVLLSNTLIAANSYYLIPILALGSFFYSIFTIYSLVFALVKKTRIIASIWFIAALVNILGNLFLIPVLGLTAAALTTLSSYFIAAGVIFYYSRRFLKVHLDLKFLSKSLFSSTIMALIIYLTSPILGDGVLDLVFMVIAGGIIYLILMLVTRALNEDEIRFIKSLRTRQKK